MTDTTIYVARKVPYENGSERRAFDTEVVARNWLEELIEEEPEIEEYSIRKQSGEYPGLLYDVEEGIGKMAGHIREVPYGHE